MEHNPKEQPAVIDVQYRHMAENLQAVFDRAQSVIAFAQHAGIFGVDQVGPGQRIEAGTRAAQAQRGIAPAVDQLVRLGIEFDLADPAAAFLEVEPGAGPGRAGVTGTDALRQPADFGDGPEIQTFAPHERTDRGEKTLAGSNVAGAGTRPDEGRPFPRQGRAFIMAQRAVDRDCQRTDFRRRTQAQVDAEDVPFGIDVAHGLHQRAGDPLRRFPRFIACAAGERRRVIKQDRIDIRAVIKLLRAVLAQCQRQESRRFGIGHPGADGIGDRGVKRAVGKVRQGPGDLQQGQGAGQIADCQRDGQRLLFAAQRGWHVGRGRSCRAGPGQRGIHLPGRQQGFERRHPVKAALQKRGVCARAHQGVAPRGSHARRDARSALPDQGAAAACGGQKALPQHLFIIVAPKARPMTIARMFPVAALGASLLLAAGASHPAVAKPAPAVPTVKPQAISIATLKDVTRTLSSDAFEGRSPGSPAEQKTVDEIIRQFSAAGLKPGNKGQWTQDVPTVVVEAINYSPLTVTARGKATQFVQGKDFVAGSYRHVPRTALTNAPLVFVGFGINAPELGWNDYAGQDMKGKIAVILVNDPDYAMTDESGLFKGRRMTYYGRWTYKYEEAARQGAAGALIIHDTFPAAYGWQVVQTGWTGKKKYVAHADNGMDQTQANGWISGPAAQSLFTVAGHDLAALTAAAKRKGFSAVPLGASASLAFDNTIERTQSRNVIGIQPGRTRPDEYVLYTAHWDHLGRCGPDKTGDDICNGAIDNATGMAAMVALAQANQKAGPAARTQVYLAVTLEESGLLGSEYYAANPVYPLARTVGGVNMDALLPGSPARDLTATGGDKSDLTRYLQKAATAMKMRIVAEPYAERGGFYRSDHFSLAKQGVPMLYVKRGTDWIKGGKAAGTAAFDQYSNVDYHQPSDEFREDWDWTGPQQDVALFYRVGRSLAETTAWPNWHQTDEFRLIRDASRAGSR